MTYFERPLPRALIFGSFFAIFLPLVLLQLGASASPLLPYALMAQAVGLGTSHFFVTLALYLQSANLDYFASSLRNRVVYFGVPVAILVLFALSEALDFRAEQPLLAAYVFGTVRFLDFFHVGRQSVGMLQLWKRGLHAALPGWLRSAENAFFVGMALLQWQTFALGGGRFVPSSPSAALPAAVLGMLGLFIAGMHGRGALIASGRSGRYAPLAYFVMQAVCAAAAVYETRLYLVALTLHYVEYHVIMMPRCFYTPLSESRAVDRISAFLRKPALLFYAALAAVVLLFEARTRVALDSAATTTFFVHVFDGIFLLHYFVEAFLWKFGNPFYRSTLAPLYFAPWPPQAAAANAASPAPSVLEPTAPAAVTSPALRGTARRTLLLCGAFFVSGASALAFEALWFHQAGLAFGNSVWASSLVLSGLMAGMGLGNWLAARRGDRLQSGLGAYALLELVVAVSGVALVYALPFSGAWLAPLARGNADTPLLLNGLRLGSAFVLLALPSIAMGMTLPLLVRIVRAWDPNFGRVLGRLYAANTAGAVLGVLGVELLLLPAFGIRVSGWLAGALNCAAAIVAWALWRNERVRVVHLPQHPAGSQPVASSAAMPGGQPLRWLVAAFGAGFALLALEVVWLRFALLFLNDTPLAFALILATVLAGIAAGGLAASLWASVQARLGQYAALLACLTGIGALAGYRLYPLVLERFYAPDQSAATVLALCVPLVLPASFASGALFAALGEGLRREGDSDARAAGRLAFANTLGAGAGSLVAGFALLPQFGMERSLFALFALYGMIAALLATDAELRPALRYGGVLALALALAFFPFGAMRAVFIRASAGRWLIGGGEIAEVREGLTGTLVHVVHGRDGLPLFDQLATNAYSMSVNDFAGRRYMELFVVLPRALHPRLTRALVVGYGIGNTAAALTQSPELERIDVADISADILALGERVRTRSARHPLEDPRVHVHVEDGRYFLQTTEQRFDLITGEPPPPVVAGVANLYTREYFELVRSRLRPGGIASYWLPVMNISAATTKSLVRGFCDAFTDCSLWHGSGKNFMLLGTRDAGAQGPVAEERFASAWSDPMTRDALLDVGFELPAQLGALFIGDADYLRALTRGVAPLTDDQPRRIEQSGTRQERDALTWEWRDTAAARERFAASPYIARLFPAAVRKAALRQFENQRLINDLLFPGATAARKTQVLHQLLHGTPLRLPVLLLLGSDPDIQRALRNAPEAQRERPEWQLSLAAGALADRDYANALRLLAGVPDERLPFADLRDYLQYVIERAPAAR